MPRRVRPWWRTSRKGWYAKVHGMQHNLGVTDPDDEAAAWAALERLVAKAKAGGAAAGGGVRPGTVAELAEQFLAEKAQAVRPHTAAQYRRHLAALGCHSNGATVAALDLQLVPKGASPDWSPTYRAHVLCTWEMFLRWAGRPHRFAKPARESRGPDAVIPEAVYRRCLRETHGDFRQVLRFLWHTGCRPGEAARATVADLDREKGQVRLRQHKTAHRTGRPRVIYLDAEASAVAGEQADRYGTGLLFRATMGRPFTQQAFTMRFERLSAKVGHRVRSYDLRHSWATRALAAGESDTIVAALMGHRSPQVLHASYSHVGQQSRVLAQAASRLGQKAG